jgi:spore maturation protein CgeB
LLQKTGIRYLWAEHPGFQIFKETHPLVGENFSRAMNSCRIFVTTGSQYRNPHAKYVESMASRTMLLADEPLGAAELRLENGVNYVKMTEETIFDLLDYYLSRPRLCEEIAEQGYRTALKHHTCHARALDFERIITERFPTLLRSLN